MKPSRNSYNSRQIRLIIGLIAIVTIGFGIWFSSANMAKYFRGYFAYRTDYQTRQTDENVQSDESEKDPSNLSAEESTKQPAETPVLYSERPESGDDIGELYIPKLDLTLPIYEGTSEDELEKGIGHYADSVLPGENDNSVLSGHRDTVFRELGDVGVGDTLIVRTSAGEFEYKVSKVRIVDKDDRTVIVPKPKATLTVSTCYPFDFIGSAPDRYILVGYLSSQTLY